VRGTRGGPLRRHAPLWAAALLATSAAKEDPGRWVIPPGREAQIAEMLGGGAAALPGPCRLSRASVEKAWVTAWFDCGAVVRLQHRDAAGAAVRKTRELGVVVVEGRPSEAFLDALLDRIRTAEAKWRWVRAGDTSPRAPRPAPRGSPRLQGGGAGQGGGSAPAPSDPSTFAAWVLVVAGVASGGIAVAWLVRRRQRGGREGGGKWIC
jgi:hypothetical protein